MPTVTCPGCHRKLAVPFDRLTTVIECPACQVEFNASTGQTVAAGLGDNQTQPPPVRRTRRAEDPEQGEPERSEQPEWRPPGMDIEPQRFTLSDFSPEPWYYRFLETYAKVVLWLGIVLIACGALWSLISAIRAAEINASLAAITILFTLMAAGAAVLSLLLAVAFILLAVDAARNLREIRREQSEVIGILGRAERQKRG